MEKEYRVNNIFNNNGDSLNDLITKIFLSFLEEDLDILEFNDILKSDTTLNI